MSAINFIKKYYSFILLILVIALSVFSFQTCSTLKQEREDREYMENQNAKNLKTLSDSITSEFNRRLKAYEFTKDNFVVQKLSELEKYNKELTEELKKVKGDVISAIKSEANIDLGGISVSNDLTVIDSTTNKYGLNFETKYEDAGLKQEIAGVSKFFVTPDNLTKNWKITPDETVLNKNLTDIRITYGFKETKDQYQVFAIPKSEKIKITELDGAYIINKQPPPPLTRTKRFGVGPYIGYGLNTYNVDDVMGIDFGWSVGVSLHYDLFKF